MAEVKIAIIADVSRATNGLKAVQSACENVTSKVWEMAKSFAPVALGAAAFAKLSVSIASAVPETVRLATETYKLQRITGMTASSASELIAVADQVGVSFGAVENAVVQVARKMGGLKGIEDMVADASGQMVDIFEKFHITIKNTDGSLKTFSDVFEQIRKKIQSASSETEKMAIATQFFRGSAAELMPILTMSSGQWKEIADDAKKYGIILTQDNVTAVRKYIMVQRDLDDAILGFKLTVGTALIPILKDAAANLTSATKAVRDFASENRALLSLPWDTIKYVKDNFVMLTLSVSVLLLTAFSAQIAGWIASLGALSISILIAESAMKGFILSAAFLAAYKLGEDIGKWASGLQDVGNMMDKTSVQQEYLNKRSEKYNTTLKELGFQGSDAMKQFNSAVVAGTVVWDNAVKHWVNLSLKQKEIKNDTMLTTKALQEQSAAMSKLGEATLKIAGDEFSAALKSQEKSIDGMSKSLTSYLKTIDSVYEKQLEGQKASKIKMEFAGADKGAIEKQGIVIAETEKAQAMARLGAWSQYYETLKGLHAQAIDAQKQKSLELLELEKAMRIEKQSAADVELSLRQKLMTESEKYTSTQQNLDAKYQAAMALTGQEKIDALKQYRAESSGAAQAVIQDGKVIVSLQTAVNTALGQTSAATREIAAEQEKLAAAKQAELEQITQNAAALSTAMAAARAEMELYKSQIVDLGNTIAAMSLSIHVDNSQATAAVDEVKARMDSIPDITYKKIIMEVVTKASPERPFTEGMAYISDKLGSLPTGGKYTMDVSSAMSAIKMLNDMQMQEANLRSQASAYASFSDVTGIMRQADVLNGSISRMNNLLNMMMSQGQEKGSYASGVAYVPETGNYRLHSGEMVLNRRDAANYDNRKSTSITVGGITVNGGNKDPRQLAKEIVKPLQEEMRRLAAYN